MDALPMFNDTCTECLDLGPPPDLILNIPPPPLPGFLLRAPANHSNSCGAVCDWSSNHAEFIELHVQGSSLDNAWLVVLITFCVGVLALGSLLAVFLLKLKHHCRERGAKVSLQAEAAPAAPKGCEVLYPTVTDPRVLWATLTPRGTTHTLASPAKSFDNSCFVDPDEYLRLRPRVSSPTRIEHPNLPPLNLHRPLRREASDTAPIV